MCYHGAMSTVGLRELRQRASELVRRAEAGEEITVTVAGRPSVRLVAVAPPTWGSDSDVRALFAGAADDDWAGDRDLLDQEWRAAWEPR